MKLFTEKQPVAESDSLKTKLDNKSFNSEELLQRCLGNVDLAERILKRFLSEFTGDMRSLVELVEAGDHEEVCRLAHRLKGAAANIAAPAIQDRLLEVQKLGHENRLESAPQVLASLWSEFQRFRDVNPVWRQTLEQNR